MSEKPIAQRTPLVEVGGLSRVFEIHDERAVALHDVSLSFAAGEFVCVWGASGSGKTTLLNILGGLDRPTAGSHRYAGMDVSLMSPDELVRLRRSEVGMIFQADHLIESATVQENVELPSYYAGLDRVTRVGRLLSLVDWVGLKDRLHDYPSELSGGERQRVAIARALMNGPRLILADEPTGALDSEQAGAVVSLLERMAKEGRTVVIVSHDPKLAARANRRIELTDGTIASDSMADRQPESTASRTRDGNGPDNENRSTLVAMPIGRAMLAGLSVLKRLRWLACFPICCMAGGIWAATVLVAIAASAYVAVMQAVEESGANLLAVGGHELTETEMRIHPKSLADAQAIDLLPNVRRTIPVISGRLRVSRGPTVIEDIVVQGMSDDTARTREGRAWAIGTGEFLTTRDDQERAQVAVLGPEIAARLFGGGNVAVGEYIQVGTTPFVVKGVLSRQPRSHGGRTTERGYEVRESVVMVPFSTGADLVFGTDKLRFLDVVVDDVGRIEETATAIKDLMFRRRGLEYWVRSKVELREAADRLTDMNALALAALAGAALVVCGLGVMAVMLAVVSRRVPEIGIRMAVGAHRKDILFQFVSETTVLTAFGGVLGVSLAFATFGIIHRLASVPVYGSPSFILAALLCSIIVGFVSGIVPARRASHLDPVTALAV